MGILKMGIPVTTLLQLLFYFALICLFAIAFDSIHYGMQMQLPSIVNIYHGMQRQSCEEFDSYTVALTNTLNNITRFSSIDYEPFAKLGIYSHILSRQMDDMSEKLDNLLSKNVQISDDLESNLYEYIDMIHNEIIIKSKDLSKLANSTYHKQESVSMTFIIAIDNFIKLITNSDFDGITDIIYAFYEYMEELHHQITNIYNKYELLALKSKQYFENIFNLIKQQNINIDHYDKLQSTDIINVFLPFQILLHSVNESHKNEGIQHSIEQLKNAFNAIKKILNNLESIKKDMLENGIPIIPPNDGNKLYIGYEFNKTKSPNMIQPTRECFVAHQNGFKITLNHIKENFMKFNKK